MALWVKDPSDEVWFNFDWSSFLGASETITSYTLTVGSALTKMADNNGSQKVNFKVSGGVTGDICLVTCSVNTSDDNTFNDEKNIYVVPRKAMP